MQDYRHVLFPTDLSAQARIIGARAKDIAARYGARLTLVHVVVEPTVSAPPGIEDGPLVFKEIVEPNLDEARAALAQLASELGLGDGDQVVLSAPSLREALLDMVAERGIDLIVVGSHSPHGLALLLGSKVDGLLHHTPCDLFAVHLPD